MDPGLVRDRLRRAGVYVEWLANGFFHGQADLAAGIEENGNRSMKLVNVNIPAGLNCEVFGSLYTCNDPADRGQDMIEVCFANGLTIEGGWLPDADPRGGYVVSITQGLRVIEQRKAKDVDEAARMIEQTAESIARGEIPRAAEVLELDGPKQTSDSPSPSDT